MSAGGRAICDEKCLAYVKTEGNLQETFSVTTIVKGMRRRDKPLDICKKLQIVRAMEDLVVEDEALTAAAIVTEKSSESDPSKAATKKKKLNIPVGDVKTDPIYETIVSADFVVPQSYVRYTKKIGDEEDPTIDYCLEDDDRVFLSISPSLSFTVPSLCLSLYLSYLGRNGSNIIRSLVRRPPL
jgi:hypothetical protein